MTADNPKNMVDLFTKGGIGAIAIILLYILFHFGDLYYTKIEQMNKQLLSIRIELAKIQSTLINKDEISNLIDQKINVHEIKYHGGK